MSNWSQPQCESCWIEANAEWDLASDGNETWQKLVSVRKPFVIRDPQLEKCAWCGYPTIVGIYVREDPSKLPYATLDFAHDPNFLKEDHEGDREQHDLDKYEQSKERHEHTP